TLEPSFQDTQKHIFNYSYSSEDSFNVVLISKSDQGCFDTTSQMIVTFAQPLADYQIPNDSQCWQKNYFNIINSSTIKYGTLQHNWDFGDGSSDTNFTPLTKKYANKSASYIVRYKVTSNYGCEDSLNHAITLLERPIADFLINDSVQCFNGHLFSFTNTTNFSALNTVSYYWDYGNSDTSIGIKPKTAAYNTPVYHPVQLIAYSYLTNCYDTFIHQVLPAPHPVSDFIVGKDSQCLRFNSFQLTNTSSISLGSQTYVWDFKDGQMSTLKDPIKKYLSGGSYAIKLVSTSNYGCKDSIEHPVVLIPHPLANFTVNDTAQCLNKQAFNLINTTNVAYGTFKSEWSTDDAQTFNNKDVIGLSFLLPGYHNIELAVESNYGCTDTFQRAVFLENNKNTFITINTKDSQCYRGNLFGLNSNCSDPNVIHQSYTWNLDDGNTLSSKDINYSYKSDGNYNVILETVSANTCLDTAIFSLVVFPHPINSFTANPPCFPDSIYFINLFNRVWFYKVVYLGFR
ncbi:MAG: PKD domain-containing protein, partial [Bacteroidia bacterium]